MGKTKILIVEDEAIIAMEIGKQLESLGYKVSSIVDTGEKAIELAEKLKPDIILMDIRINGEIDGIDTAQVIRDRFDIPVIFSTAYLDQERIERAKITMPFGYLLKPIQERDLKATIEMALYVAKIDKERRKVESRLTESEKQRRTWLENSPDCTKIVDLAFNLQYMSSAGVRGLRIDDITPYYGKPYPFDFYPDSFKIQMRKNLAKAKETGKTITQEAPVLNMEGNEVWFHSTIVPVNDNESKLDYIMVVSIDTTERKQSEQRLLRAHDELLKVNEKIQTHQIELEAQNAELKRTQQQHAELQSKYFELYNCAPVGYLTLDDKGLISEANLMCATILGVDISILKKMSFINFVDSYSQETFYYHRKFALETKAQQTCELTLIKQDKTKFRAQLESKAIFDDKGDFIQMNTNMIYILKQ